MTETAGARDICDLVIVGGGINGTAIARAASLAGLTVLLVERNDLGGGTSSASTKLIHGGLRYLEHGEFSLVRESLRERAILLRTAPHLVEPLQFILEPTPEGRPWAMLRAGLWIYDLLAIGGTLPRSRSVTIDDQAGGRRRALAYWDARVDDSRLVVLNALDAAGHGAAILVQTRVTAIGRAENEWRVSLADGSGVERTVLSRFLINAAGPWAGMLHGQATESGRDDQVRLVRGSHLVLRRKPADAAARLLQMPDGRVVFVIPYQRDFVLVGTTDIPVARPDDRDPDAREVDYLLAAANRHLREPATEADIVWRFGGIRALFDDGSRDISRISREYHFEVDRERGLLSIIGGKITTARNLAEHALKALGLPAGSTRERPLPGGDIASFETFLDHVRTRWPFLGTERSLRMARAYGSRIETVLGDAKDAAGLGADFGQGLSEREVRYLCDAEWAHGAEDILWRRTKLGLLFTREQTENLQSWMAGHMPAREARRNETAA